MSAFGACTECSGHCCRVYTVPIIGSDVHRLAREMDLAPRQFATLGPEEDPASGGIRLAPDGPALGILLQKRNGHRQPSPCVFLVELPDGTGRCGVYPDRPLVCSTFPTYFHRGSVDIRPDVLCPPGSWRLGTMDLPDWRHGLLRMEMEQSLHRVVVAHWNEHVDRDVAGAADEDEFFDFLLVAYDEIDALRRDVEPDAYLRLVHDWGRQDGDGAWRTFLRDAAAVL